MPAPVFTHDRLDQVAAAHGRHASWAVWAPSRHRPSSTWLGDLSVLDTREDPRRLHALHRDTVLVVLEPGHRAATRSAPAWSAFHDPADPSGRAPALAAAVRGTPAWGSYLTPLLKDPARTTGSPPPRPGELDRAVVELEDELEMLGGDPVLVCLGEQVGAVVRDALGHRCTVRTVDVGQGPRSRARLHAELAGVLADRVVTPVRRPVRPLHHLQVGAPRG